MNDEKKCDAQIWHLVSIESIPLNDVLIFSPFFDWHNAANLVLRKLNQLCNVHLVTCALCFVH